MGKIRQSAFTLISVVAFIILAAVATVEYSGNKEKANVVREGELYQDVSTVLKKTEKLLTNPASLNIEKTVASEQGLVSSEEKNKFLDKVKEYIQIEKTTEGWQITLQNNEEIIFQKTF
jgi:hypothetical protein